MVGEGEDRALSAGATRHQPSHGSEKVMNLPFKTMKFAFNMLKFCILNDGV